MFQPRPQLTCCVLARRCHVRCLPALLWQKGNDVFRKRKLSSLCEPPHEVRVLPAALFPSTHLLTEAEQREAAL